MNVSALQIGLLKWAASVLGDEIPVILANSNKPAPKTTWISMDVKALSQVGEDYVGGATEVESPGTGFENVVTGTREIMVYFLGIGVGALQALSNLRDSLQKESVRDALLLDALIYVRAEDVQDLTNLIEQTMVERGAFDTRFRTDSRIGDPVEVIEKATDIEATFNHGAGDAQPLDQDFSIGE